MNVESKKHGRFEFFNDWPDDVMADVIEHFRPYEWLLPPWCHYCVMMWDNKETNAISRANGDFAYRRMNITVGPQWLSLSKEEKLNTARHELLHAFNTLISDYAIAEVERLLTQDESPTLRSTIIEQIKLRTEQATCDLEFCLDQWLKSNES